MTGHPYQSEPVEITVLGRPAPKGSRTRGTRRNGSSFTRPASRYEHEWTDAVATACLPVRARVDPPYAVTIRFAVERPAKSTHGYPTRGDLDKLTRATIDGLVRGRLLVDDRHVTVIHATVAYGEPTGAMVEVATAREAPRTVAA